MVIKFGTSGWRAVIGEEFTYDNVKLVTQAIADYVNEHKDGNKSLPGVIIGYDTRYGSEWFAETSACVLAANNIRALYCKRDTPTPVISFEIVRRKLAGGINMTASHNPPEYNGLKFSPAWGGPALPEETKDIEAKIKSYAADRSKVKYMSFEEGKKKKLIEEVNPQAIYLKRIAKLVDLDSIKKAKLKIGIDLLYGTGRGYLDTLLKETGCKVSMLHNYRDVLFGGRRPEPDKEALEGLKDLVLKQKLSLGLSVDGDADRFGVIDSDGTFLTPNQVITLLLYHLIKVRKWKGGVAVRSVMTTHFIDAVAAKYDVEVKETPVGFKYIGDIMVNPETRDRFIIGGEESGGLSIRHHVPEKDGVLACLLLAEVVAKEKKPLGKVLKDLEELVGKHLSSRANIRLTPQLKENLVKNLQGNLPSEIAGIKIKDINKMDGYKFVLDDGSWLGLRLSGTEPLVRLYVEADSGEKLNLLLEGGKKLIGV
jgi:phosphoglucomutase